MAIKIGVWGASTTYGAKDNELGGWVNRLRLYFSNNNQGILVNNCGVSGAIISEILDRFEIEAKHRQPDIIIFSLGSNDGSSNEKEGKPKVSLEDFERYLQKLISKSKKFTKEVIFTDQFKIEDSKTNPVGWGEFYYKNSRIQEYNSIIEKICKQHNLTFISLQNVLDIKEDLADGLHPNARGHEKIFKKVLPVVAKIEKKLEDCNNSKNILIKR
ncbi:MAG: SGNH/GDSL hydrolase family protein [Nanoarchaeota archaeon]